ncbi:tubulin-like doman-containing protein [Urbifossiella limnaea]|uniref:Tubulin-like protein n=1 Tax=Urbifossiella limnaea TaxID=2528023 RepID=A0A517XMZ2_9BACT|nr:tubulin-like doman-containing protein [Urbifossiella limnaea]QDU18874.1 Tubulin-like protein [Urbifossiella limnaea]
MSVRIESHAEPIPGYKLLDRLGSGGFGEVWRCEAPGGINKAVKVIFGDLRSQDNDLVRYAEQELKALKRVKQVRHPYLLALDRYDIVDGKLMIVMELADCNLWDRFRECREKGHPGIPRDELLGYMREAAEVLDLMNDQFGLQHLDIKPQNLFLLYNHVKVADFGQVKDLQGVMASVTGGITPVYAAPETFDGLVSRYCDQYSLACVYQELLTGQRPFDGTSMSQLLMQHLQLPPDLAPSPPADRPALLRALAKRPDDRWPTVSAFVRAIQDGGGGSGAVGRAAPTADSANDLGPKPGSGIHGLELETPSPRGLLDTDNHAALITPAPPEVTGDGPLRPAVVIGIGQAGLRVAQRLRFELAERYGPAEFTPLVRTLAIDTDPDTLDDAERPRPQDRLAALPADCIIPAKLNRASHYLKPRLNGRNLTDGWFDPQLLYRIPRTPQTMGLRLFGRLAFMDHYRTVMAKLGAELEAALAPDSLHLTEQRTGLRRRTNRPRVYVVAGAGGGTGGGMLLDVAYAVRARLKRMGYESPELVGVLFLPPADASLAPPQALGNAYATLTELNHYTRPDTTFTAHYDDRSGAVKEKDAPFTRVLLVPGPAGAVFNGTRSTPPATGVVGRGALTRPAPAGVGTRMTPPGIAVPGARKPGSGATGTPGSRVVPVPGFGQTPEPAGTAFKAVTQVAELIRLDLFTPVGRTADAQREAKLAGLPPGVTVGAFGVAAFDWPRAEVVVRTAETVSRKVLTAWLLPNVKRAREVIPTWAAAQWTRMELDPDAVLARLQAAAESATGARTEDLIAAATEPLVPKGWLARLPEPERVAVAVDGLVKLFGPPSGPAHRVPTAAEGAVAEAALAVANEAALHLRTVVAGLVEDPQFRLAGAEEATRQFLATTDRLAEKYYAEAAAADLKATAAYECLVQYTHFQKGMRKPAAAEIADALRLFPRARYQGVLHRTLARLYQTVRDPLEAQLADVSGCRERLAEVAGPVGPAAADFIPGPRRLMPPGCLGVDDAVARFEGVLTDADQAAIDARVQALLEPEHGGLFQACFSSSAGPEGVVAAVREEARSYLDARLGDVDMGAMFAERFRSRQSAEAAVGHAFAEAEPEWVGGGPWTGTEVTVLAVPDGVAGAPVRELAARAIPVAGLPTADSRDDVTIYREYPAVPLSAVPHLGPAGSTAYQNLPESNQCSLHSRLDVTAWTGVDD